MGRIAYLVALALVVACGGKTPATQGTCGDGVVDGNELCDDSSPGCTSMCTFTCIDPVADCDGAACQIAVCTSDHVCALVPMDDGAACGTNEVCSNGACGPPPTCGNGIKEAGEACDFGTSNGINAGCEENCTLSCANQAACDDNNPCNGVEACDPVTVSGQVGQKCSSGTSMQNGASCGSSMICLNEACTAATCGDSYTSASEECDDANVTAGDGCENNCTYSCVSTDATRNCTPADACKGQGTCNDTTHRCAAGTALANNTPCGTGGYCLSGTCTQPVCTNGTKEPGETCDDGNQANGDGCDNDCTYSCVNAATDCGSPQACQMYTCSAQHTCQSIADATQNGNACGVSGQTCSNGACTSGVCGNGITEAGEQCDFGASNGPGTGCESNCRFSCSSSPNSCNDGNACNGLEACNSVTVSGHAGMKCGTGTPLADNSACATSKICKAQLCVASICGDSYLDSAVGESCEPPNTATCDASCHVKVCGDGVRAGTEQCDDGNTTNLDGCSATCEFEQCHRMNELDIQFGTDTYCTANAFGAAAGSITQGLISDAINAGVADGTITIIFKLIGLGDLTGTTDPSLSLGVLGATPAAGTGYTGNSDLDWWYTVDPTDIDSTRAPIQTVPATIAAKMLNAGPAEMGFTVNFVGVDVTMNMFNTKIRAPIGAATTPLTSAGTTPGHQASEHLDPSLQSFATMGTTAAPAELCGATTAASLANTHVPTKVVQYCSNFTISHSLLDLYIGGCTYAFIFTVVKATQPDTARTSGDVYRFQANAQRFVTSCTKNGQPAVLSDCLNNAGYSSFYKFTTDRVIGK